MSFLDNLENNLKALESRDEGGLDEDRRRTVERARSIAVAPWAYRLKNEPYAQALMQLTTIAGRQRRTKVNLAWIDTTLSLEARGHRLELRPTPDGIVAVFLRGSDETKREPIDLAHDPAKLTDQWMPIIDEQKRLDDVEAAAAAAAEADDNNEAMPS
jgi:hypothetical protein